MRAHLKLDKSGVDRKIQILGSTSVIDSGTLSSFTQTAVKTIVMEIKGWFASLSVIHDVHICKNPTWRSFKPFFPIFLILVSVFKSGSQACSWLYSCEAHFILYLCLWTCVHNYLIHWIKCSTTGKPAKYAGNPGVGLGTNERDAISDLSCQKIV